MDTQKGTAILALVFLHAAVYNFAGLAEVDLENPPALVAIIGVMALWGGLFAVMSGVVNSYRYALRQSDPPAWNPRRRLLLVGLGLIILHVVYSMLTSPPALDFDTGNHDYSLVSNIIREGRFYVSPVRIVEGTALLMLGPSLMLLALALPALCRARRPAATAAAVAAVLLAAGLLRFPLFPVFEAQLEAGRYLRAFLLSVIVGRPYPVLPYAAFMFAGAAFGLAMARTGRPPRLSWLAGLVVLGVGVAGVMSFPTNLYGVDWFWYAKVFLELGIFVLITWAVLASSGAGRPSHHILQRVGRMSLTVYVIQVPVSELIAEGLTAISPGWNNTIGAAVLFGAANVALWMGIVALWSMARYRGTMEHLWVTIFRGSTKLDGVGPAPASRERG
jgi:peptidoglycan/LPS O-acetylase OafA/YrhL